MNFKNLFDEFSLHGKLHQPNNTVSFNDIPWSKHPTFEGVELKHIITSSQTNNQFSFHLVRIAPNKSIEEHIHTTQLETHEVISGTGFCIQDGNCFDYVSGMISIFPIGQPHTVIAGEDGLYLFAKFIPALC